ncbi:MAG: hypothetical protein AAB632_03365 [Patescibacteria group bacterium]
MKKIKGIFKNKLVLLFVGALIIGFGGAVLYLSQTDKPKKEENKQEETKKDEGAENQTEKGNLPTEQSTPKAPAPVQEKAPTGNLTSLGNLVSSVTAQKSVSDDSIAILFYLESAGAFTVQEKVGSAWQTTMENVSYAGRGGLQAGTLASGQASKTLRVLKIENGKYTAVTKEFTVNRAEVEAALGIKTYN